MKQVSISQKSEEWLRLRRKKITGTKLGKVFYKSRKKDELYDYQKPAMGFYELLAERLTVEDDESLSPMERGHALEAEALEQAKARGYIGEYLTDVFWEDGDFGCSPDAVENSESPTWAVEVKCLSSPRHLKAIIDEQFPEEYEPQIINYFLANDKLEQVTAVMYDPRFFEERLKLKTFLYKREDVLDKIKQYSEARAEAQKQLKQLESELIGF